MSDQLDKIYSGDINQTPTSGMNPSTGMTGGPSGQEKIITSSPSNPFSTSDMNPSQGMTRGSDLPQPGMTGNLEPRQYGVSTGPSTGPSGQERIISGIPSNQFSTSDMNPSQGMTRGSGFPQPTMTGNLEPRQYGVSTGPITGPSGQERIISGISSIQSSTTNMNPSQEMTGRSGFTQPTMTGNVESGQCGISTGPSKQFQTSNLNPSQEMTGRSGFTQPTMTGNLEPGQSGISTGPSGQERIISGIPSNQFSTSDMNPNQGMTGRSGFTQPTTTGNLEPGQSGISTGSEQLGRKKENVSGMSGGISKLGVSDDVSGPS